MTSSEEFLNQAIEPFDHDIKNCLSQMALIDLGTLGEIREDGSTDVTAFRFNFGKAVIYKDVEVLYPAGMGRPITGGLCLVFRPDSVMSSLKNNTIALGEGAYGASGAKAIPVSILSGVDVSAGMKSDGSFSIEGSGVSLSVEETRALLTYGDSSCEWDNGGGLYKDSYGGLINSSLENGKLVYKVSDETGNSLFNFSIDADGTTSLDISETASGNVDINIGNSKISVSEGKNISIEDANQNSITLDENGITTTSASLTSIGNNSATVGSLLQDLSTILQTLGTVGSQTAQTVDPATIANLVEWGVKVQQVLS